MKIQDLQFDYPESLIAQRPEKPSRVMWVENRKPSEISIQELLHKFKSGDVLVINSTRVLKRRVYTQGKQGQELEILFLKPLSELEWEVLFPSKAYKIDEVILLPLGVTMSLVKKGRPQIIRLSRLLTEADFEKIAEIPLPPYIQKARGERHTVNQDETWYQTAWAKQPGSLAAPTASLHFSQDDLTELKKIGVQIHELILHVGLGTFLPVTTEDLDQHDMHEEFVEIPASTWIAVNVARAQGHRVWALGTTVTRSLESAALGLLPETKQGFSGFTKLLIQPGFQWQKVDVLLTNFHQPESTLLALVSAFADLPLVRACYQWAIKNKFRLFSYGDLSAWVRD